MSLDSLQFKPMNHSFWHHIPIVRLLLPFSAGIGISMFYPLPFTVCAIAFLSLFLLAVIIYFRLQQFNHRWVFGTLISLGMFWGGMALHQYRNELLSELVIKINEQPVPKATSYKMKCKVLGAIDSNETQTFAEGSLIVYVRRSTTAFPYQYGEVLTLPMQKVKPVSPPQNPDEFNYKRYLAFNNIYFQAYLEESEFFPAWINEGNQVRKWVYDVQQYFKAVLLKCIGSQNETGVAEALLYGYDDDIDTETVQAYSNTGTLHVLAVSGMHVGIIFMILGLFLRFMDKTRQLKIAKGIIILIALWLYSLLCGLSPSILRATVMFTFIIAADLLNVRSSVYNTLAASAFVLLCIDPNMLANVGFQLSYLAVIGIVFFQPYIYDWYTAPNRVMDEIWKITAVSLAAQLVTCPIGLLYFHQFPNCFLFSNLIIIPLTTIILHGNGAPGSCQDLMGRVADGTSHVLYDRNDQFGGKSCGTGSICLCQWNSHQYFSKHFTLYPDRFVYYVFYSQTALLYEARIVKRYIVFWLASTASNRCFKPKQTPRI
jgi:competence protein ComEC